MEPLITRKLQRVLSAADEIAVGEFVSRTMGQIPATDNASNIDAILDWLETDTVDNEAKKQLLEAFGIDDLRICDLCGKVISRGYVLDDLHACCKEHAAMIYKLIGLDEKMLDRHLDHSCENEAAAYYTEF